MKLGMLTACLPGWSLDRIAGFAQQQGYERLEVAVWPGTGGRDFEAAHLPVATFTDEDALATRALLDRTGLEISALAYYENNLHQDPEHRAAVRTHLKHAIDTAQTLGIPYLGTFIGRDTTKSVRENMAEGNRVLPELVDYAGERGVRLVIENCVMEGWHPDGYPGNIAYSPELWGWVTGLGFGLNWDPSHLTWIGIDPVETILPFAEHIVHAQAKDLELFPERRNEYGFFGKVDKGDDPWDMGWWRFRVPGRGVVDWPRVVDRLYEAGFDGTLSVEHEDPLWGGTDDRVLEGLRIAHRTLRPLIAQEQ
ncbi:sugar phosphate isomerase/epimerase [Curtobacterium flaccumfaciens]|uniref:sugar phosphate isomerase/epimerase family protein n=1 Tax=Curtobacterium flaccumfaciens TaxID=2035 RepID=UPI0021C921AF|nr:sugar phosphate isomerase/epimerase [Curtobacterium flaccumfaciens]UXN23302.1 sugar phosphate isomerase/epimerase [Curtobacterium flaccumfaciens pv. flaccumfaciens]